MKKLLFLLIFTVLCGIGVFANNINISNVKLRVEDQDKTNKTHLIRFNLSRDNSWRTDTYESNWDAAWIFVKFRNLFDTQWRHALITSSKPHSSANIDVPTDRMGAFISRKATGCGSNDFADVQLVWSYGANGLLDDDSVEVCVLGLEMVYVPQGEFLLGDGQSNSTSRFVCGTTQAVSKGGNGNNTPFKVTASPITIGNSLISQLWTVDGNRLPAAGALPSTFLTGYNGFYCMKYELTQQQFCEFLNKILTPETHWKSVAGNNYELPVYFATNVYPDAPFYRNGIRRFTDGYYCDLSQNGTPNENGDGMQVAYSFADETRTLAYADWAGLRPMTELEYEKACRGKLNPIPNEKAWGFISMVTPTNNISNPGENTEVATKGSPNTANAVVNYIDAPNPVATTKGPVRVGGYAGSSTTRQQSGATYYGIMNMGDNVSELVVYLGAASFNLSNHGNGELNATSNFDVAGWSTDPNAWVRKGGSFAYTISAELLRCNVSDRQINSSNYQYGTTRHGTSGIRLVRSHP